MGAQTAIWSTAEALASALFEAMPQILDGLARTSSANPSPAETQANHASWRAEVAKVIAGELKRMNPNAGALPLPKSGRHVLLPANDLDSWESDIGKVARGEAGEAVLALVRSRMIIAAANAQRYNPCAAQATPHQ
jgi:hypothetical protein